MTREHGQDSAWPARPAVTARLPAPRPSLRFMFSHPAHVVALGFGSGLARWAPGTFGTAFGWLVWSWLLPPMHDAVAAGVIVAATLLAWWASTRTAQHLAVADPSSVVCDEVVAFWLVLWLIAPASLLEQAVAFAVFRVFDAVKPGPVAWADRLWKVRGSRIGWAQGFGIVLDDVVAALCTLLVMAAWRFVHGLA